MAEIFERMVGKPYSSIIIRMIDIEIFDIS